MGLTRFRIRCLCCRDECFAQHVHGSMPLDNGRVHRGRPLRCWNECLGCGTLYEALPCGDKERKHQRTLEKHGQTKMDF